MTVNTKALEKIDELTKQLMDTDNSKYAHQIALSGLHELKALISSSEGEGVEVKKIHTTCGVCPTCSAGLILYSNYCQYCGQKLIWPKQNDEPELVTITHKSSDKIDLDGDFSVVRAFAKEYRDEPEQQGERVYCNWCQHLITGEKVNIRDGYNVCLSECYDGYMDQKGGRGEIIYYGIQGDGNLKTDCPHGVNGKVNSGTCACYCKTNGEHNFNGRLKEGMAIYCKWKINQAKEG